MTTDQLRERDVREKTFALIAAAQDREGMARSYAAQGPRYLMQMAGLLADILEAVLLSPSPRGDEGGLADVAPARAAVSLKRTPQAEPLSVTPDFWQPIETAPKDTRLLVGWCTGEVIATSLHEDTLAHWKYGPTHWRPLPPPPVPSVLLGDTGTAATQRYDPPLPTTGAAGTGEPVRPLVENTRAAAMLAEGFTAAERDRLMGAAGTGLDRAGEGTADNGRPVPPHGSGGGEVLSRDHKGPPARNPHGQ